MALPDPITDLEAALDAGYFGVEVDPTPNENYSVTGGPTPETDATAKAAAQARKQELRDAYSGRDPAEVTPSKSSRSSSSSSSSSSS